jgi:hypothetical protein
VAKTRVNRWSIVSNLAKIITAPRAGRPKQWQ